MFVRQCIFVIRRWDRTESNWFKTCINRWTSSLRTNSPDDKRNNICSIWREDQRFVDARDKTCRDVSAITRSPLHRLFEQEKWNELPHQRWTMKLTCSLQFEIEFHDEKRIICWRNQQHQLSFLLDDWPNEIVVNLNLLRRSSSMWRQISNDDRSSW